MRNLKNTAIFTLIYIVGMNIVNYKAISALHAGHSFGETFTTNLFIFTFLWSAIYIFHIGTRFLYKFMVRGR